MASHTHEMTRIQTCSFMHCILCIGGGNARHSHHPRFLQEAVHCKVLCKLTPHTAPKLLQMEGSVARPLHLPEHQQKCKCDPYDATWN
eukprot:3993708-Amphidinium_carterae.1